jgi:hypothetical protein
MELDRGDFARPGGYETTTQIFPISPGDTPKFEGSVYQPRSRSISRRSRLVGRPAPGGR